MKHFFVVVLLSLSFSTHSEDNFISLYNGLLHDHINSGQKQGVNANLVNYSTWANDPRHTKALLTLKKLPIPSNYHQQLAHWINAYNFLTVDLITREKETDSIKNLGGFFTSPWTKHKWVLNGETYSLDQIEHKILRKMNEPRIHMAINCASLSCPDLRREAYTAAKLDSQLQKQTEKLLMDHSKGMKIIGKKITLSKIFDWFKKDFGSKQDLVAFLQQYNDSISDDFYVDDYFTYNWNLNNQ